MTAAYLPEEIIPDKGVNYSQMHFLLTGDPDNDPAVWGRNQYAPVVTIDAGKPNQVAPHYYGHGAKLVDCTSGGSNG